jgi:hypothetical protein
MGRIEQILHELEDMRQFQKGMEAWRQRHVGNSETRDMAIKENPTSLSESAVSDSCLPFRHVNRKAPTEPIREEE